MHLKMALLTALDALRGARSLLPDYVLRRVEDVNPEELDDMGIRHVVFDFDNTLARWGRRTLPPAAEATIERLRAAGIGVAVASNGFPRRFRRLADEWAARGVRFAGGCGKPDSTRLRCLLDEEGWDPHATLVVGDNTLTDVAAGRGAGCMTALVQPISWWEAPPTKLWRLLESIHRLQCRDWAGVMPMGGSASHRIRTYESHRVMALLAVLVGAGVFLSPMARIPAPTSETTSYQLGLARGFSSGWPMHGEGDADRSLLLMTLLSQLPDHTNAPRVLILGMVGLLVVGIAATCAAVPMLPPLATAIVGVTMALAPVTIAVAGEISPALIELVAVGVALTVPVGPLTAALVLGMALLNGVSAIALVPVLLVRSPRRTRSRVVATMAVAVLLASACWVMALSREPARSPSLDRASLDAVLGAGMGRMSHLSMISRLGALENGLRHALVGRTLGLFPRLPLMSAASLCAVLALAARTPAVSMFVAFRTALALLLPNLFLPSFTLVVLLPFVLLALGTVFSRVLEGRGALLFALLLAVVVIPPSFAVRRQVSLTRWFYRHDHELTYLAKQAQSTLPESACIATEEPALVFLLSERTTVPLYGEPPPCATHVISPRSDPLNEQCVATESLMLCPR